MSFVIFVTLLTSFPIIKINFCRSLDFLVTCFRASVTFLLAWIVILVVALDALVGFLGHVLSLVLGEQHVCEVVHGLNSRKDTTGELLATVRSVLGSVRQLHSLHLFNCLSLLLLCVVVLSVDVRLGLVRHVCGHI